MKTSIKIENLSKSFNGKRILKEINLELPEDGIFGILGKNGAGKTTLLATLMGLVTPTSGEIKIFNKCLRKDKFDILNEINFQSPYIELPKKMSVYQNLIFYARLYNVKDKGKKIDNLCSELLVDDLLELNYGKLSSGQKTRVNLCKALLNTPKLLLLDEPTASLDIQTSEFIRKYLVKFQKNYKSAILITSHNLEEIQYMCDYLIILEDGMVKDFDTIKNLLKKGKKSKIKELLLND
jgi:ABC-2 type transport system ATP-binding protein